MDHELLSRIKGIKSSVQWRTTATSGLILFIMNGLLFSLSLAFLSSVIRRLQLVAEFVVIVLGILNSKQSCWISPCPFYMYILLNLVIVSLAIKSGILRPSSPLIKVCSDEYSVGKLELKIQKPGNEIQRTIRIRCSKLHDSQSLPSLFSQNPSSKSNEDTANGRSSSLEQCAVAPHLFLVEVSNGSAQESDCMNMDMDSEQSCDDALCADDLNVKAENFIKDFYRQLKMQQEDYGKRIYGIVQKESY